MQTSAGRLLYEMPARCRGKTFSWSAYVCSGTAVTDSASGRSVILTAAHCVFDDVCKKFARKVLFIPNQADTTSAGTDSICSNDPVGCWAPDFGVVDEKWANRQFPDNIPWDYAYYVVQDSAPSDALDVSVSTLSINFDSSPVVDNTTHALGYSYKDDPKFMYCKEGMSTEGSDNWWLPSCGLAGGSSGGPWAQPMDEGTGNGTIVSVNSWGYTNSPGMAGPKLAGTCAECLFTKAETASFLPSSLDGEARYVDNCLSC